MAQPRQDPAAVVETTEPSTDEPSLLYAAAKLYYDEGATQAEVAAKLAKSRTTVSRLLSEARRQGIVRIEVVPPGQRGSADLAEEVQAALGLQAVFLSTPIPGGTAVAQKVLGSVLAPAVGRALTAVGLLPGEVLLVSSGRTIYEVVQSDLPSFPGVVVAPTLGGIDQPEGWFQTNELTRLLANRIQGRATYLFAPALPGPELYETLKNDPAIQRVLHLWPYAQCALVGVGPPPISRPQIPAFIAPAGPLLVEAVGDVCSRMYNRAGEPVEFAGSERMIAVDLATLRSIPAVIAVAAGPDKVTSITVGARAGYFNQLVTDPQTAESILARAQTKERGQPAGPRRPAVS